MFGGGGRDGVMAELGADVKWGGASADQIAAAHPLEPGIRVIRVLVTGIYGAAIADVRVGGTLGLGNEPRDDAACVLCGVCLACNQCTDVGDLRWRCRGARRRKWWLSPIKRGG